MYWQNRACYRLSENFSSILTKPAAHSKGKQGHPPKRTAEFWNTSQLLFLAELKLEGSWVEEPMFFFVVTCRDYYKRVLTICALSAICGMIWVVQSSFEDNVVSKGNYGLYVKCCVIWWLQVLAIKLHVSGSDNSSFSGKNCRTFYSVLFCESTK